MQIILELNQKYDHLKTKSSLEKCVKYILDKYVDDDCYINNGRKKLQLYGVNLINEKTGYYLELDRYYYNCKVAIEIQGKQHYVPTKHHIFGKDVVDRTQYIDKIKADLLKQQDIELLLIPYTQCSEAGILKIIKTSKRLKLKEI